MRRESWRRESSQHQSMYRSHWRNEREAASFEQDELSDRRDHTSSLPSDHEREASEQSNLLTVLTLGLKVFWNKVWQRQPTEWNDGVSRQLAPVGLGLASLLNALDWDHLRAEVDRESRARIVLIGARGAGKSTLLNLLKGFVPDEHSPVKPPDEEPAVENLGLFAVIDLPVQNPDAAWNTNSPLWFELENADLLLWVLDGAAGVRAWEPEWISRVRALGKTVLVVLNKLDALPESADVESWQRILGCNVIPIMARDGTNVLEDLLPRIADTSPQLATALGREVAIWRREAAERVMRRAEILSGLTGLEPVPLLDIPFQILIQLQLVLRIASIYGQPLNDRYSREMLATMVGSVALRYGGQQLVKIMPLAGWLASGVLAAGGTWVIGRIAVEYFENGRRVIRNR